MGKERMSNPELEGIDFELADLLQSYPPVSDPGFQTMISGKEEFRSLWSTRDEKLNTTRGSFFKHQLLIHRFLRNYDELLITHETGTGKTCTVAGFTEYVYNTILKYRQDPEGVTDEQNTHFRGVLVLVKGSAQKAEFRNQLVTRCSNGKYLTEAVRNAENESSRRRAINKEIKKWYTVTTYIKFASELNKEYFAKGDIEGMIRRYSDYIVWIDEGHNLLLETDETLYEDLRLPKDWPDEMPSVRNDKVQTYRRLWYFLHYIKRCKKIVSTATPMLNSSKDLTPVANLILPANGQLPPSFDLSKVSQIDLQVLFPGLSFEQLQVLSREQVAEFYRPQIPANYDYEANTVEYLEPYLRGRVSYVRALDTGALPEGQRNPELIVNYPYEDERTGTQFDLQMPIYLTRMGPIQSQAYQLAVSGEHTSDRLAAASRQAANFVFPDGFWGSGETTEERARRTKKNMDNNGPIEKIVSADVPSLGSVSAEGQRFEVPAPSIAQEQVLDSIAEVDQPSTRRGFNRFVSQANRRYRPTAELVPWLSSINNIELLSAKYAAAIRNIEANPGNAFVYFEFVEGSGAAVFALCLEGLGYERYNETSSIFQGEGDNRTIKPNIRPYTEVVEDPEHPGTYIRQVVGKPRYALYTGKTSEAEFVSMMETMNSYENRHGDYIRVFIASRSGRDGINVNNALSCHLMAPEWNPSAMYQAISRVVRATSHEDLLAEEKERLVSLGRSKEEAKLTIKIFRYAAIPDNELTSIDTHMYITAERKDRDIRRVMRMLKQVAIDCQINIRRNKDSKDIDFSQTCDYDVCDYQCFDQLPTAIDYSTYDVVYADDIVSAALVDLFGIYRTRTSASLETLIELIPGYRSKHLILALEYLINSKTPILDRYGYITYMREDGGIFYLDRNYPSSPASVAMALYSQDIIALKQLSLAEIATSAQANNNRTIINRLSQLNPSDPEFERLLVNMPLEGQALLIEEIISRVTRGENTVLTRAIMERYRVYIFHLHLPSTELLKAFSKPVSNRGRKAKIPKEKKKYQVSRYNPAKDGPIIYDENTELIYLHTLYTIGFDLTKYTVSSHYNKAQGRLRILIPSEVAQGGGWRDVSTREYPVYNKILQDQIAKNKSSYSTREFYGQVIDNAFKIVDNRGGRRRTGKVCTNWKPKDLIDIMWELGIGDYIGPEAQSYPNTPENHQALVNFMAGTYKEPVEKYQDWPFDRLMFYYNWNLAPLSSRQRGAHKERETFLCDLIYEKMKEYNLLYQ